MNINISLQKFHQKKLQPASIPDLSQARWSATVATQPWEIPRSFAKRTTSSRSRSSPASQRAAEISAWWRASMPLWWEFPMKGTGMVTGWLLVGYWLMNVDECWWMLMNVDECWWMLMNVDECWLMLTWKLEISPQNLDFRGSGVDELVDDWKLEIEIRSLWISISLKAGDLSWTLNIEIHWKLGIQSWKLACQHWTRGFFSMKKSGIKALNGDFLWWSSKCDDDAG